MATSVRNWTIFATTADNGGYDFLRSALSTEGLTILEGLRSNILPVFDSHLALEDSIAHLWSRTTILGSLLLSTLRNLLSLGAIVAGAALIWIIYLCLYQAIWHPLAKYPGPFLAKFTFLYMAYRTYLGDLHVDIWRYHEKYGPFVRYAPYALLCNTADSLDTIYHSKQCVKPNGYAVMNLKAPSTFSETNPKVHERRRRILSHGFSDAAMRGYEPCILKNIEKFIAHILRPKHGAKGWTGPQDMGQLAENFTFDVMTSVVYGTSYNLVENPERRPIVRAMEKLNIRVGALIATPWLAKVKLDRLIFRPSIRSRNLFVKFALEVLQSRKEAMRPMGDVFSVLINAKDPVTGLALDEKQLASESSNLIMAGSDTAATAISAAVFYLARHPDAYNAAANEVRHRFGSLAELRIGPALSSCQYLRGCINEAMRLSPPVGSTLWRQVVNGGLFVDGNYIPEGYYVGTSIYSIHHHKDYFPDPFAFKPERWLHPGGEEGEGLSEEARAAWNPFSIGSRGCIGKAMAMNELMLTLAALFISCDFRTPVCQEARKGEGSVEAEYGRHRIFEYQTQHYLIACRNGPTVEFRARDI